MMSEYENAVCPNCGADLGRYRLDMTSSQTVHKYCPHCHVRILVMHGNGRIKVSAVKQILLYSTAEIQLKLITNKDRV